MGNKMILWSISLLMLVSGALYGENYPVMLQIQGKVDIPEDFRDGVEEILTANGYSLIDQKSQEAALREQAAQRKKACYDDSCLLDTGKMLAARALIVAEVSQKGEKHYRFKARYVDFESGTTTKTKLLYYKSSLKEYQKLADFGKMLAMGLINGKIPVIKAPKTIVKKVPQIDEKRVTKVIPLPISTRFHGLLFGGAFELGGQYFSFAGDLERIGGSPSEASYDFTQSSTVFGFSLNLTYYFIPEVAIFFQSWLNGSTTEVSEWEISGDYGDGWEDAGMRMVQYGMVLGIRTNYGDLYGKHTTFYTSFGLGLNFLDINFDEQILQDSSAEPYLVSLSDETGMGFHMVLEGGINYPLWGGLDLYLACHYTHLLNFSYDLAELNSTETASGERESVEMKFSYLLRFTLGARFNF